MNWGQKLVAFTLVFMVFIVALVVVISRQKVDLVDDNYYEKGILYQEEINKFDVADSIKHEVYFDMPKGVLYFATNVPSMNGQMHFYRPSDARMDFTVPFKVKKDGMYEYSTTSLAKGVWKVTFEWVLNGKKMASEKQLVIE
jgi:hypothetical protein